MLEPHWRFELKEHASSGRPGEALDGAEQRELAEASTRSRGPRPRSSCPSPSGSGRGAPAAPSRRPRRAGWRRACPWRRAQRPSGRRRRGPRCGGEAMGISFSKRGPMRGVRRIALSDACPPAAPPRLRRAGLGLPPERRTPQRPRPSRSATASEAAPDGSSTRRSSRSANAIASSISSSLTSSTRATCAAARGRCARPGVRTRRPSAIVRGGGTCRARPPRARASCRSPSAGSTAMISCPARARGLRPRSRP